MHVTLHCIPDSRLDSQINILLSSATWSKRINPNPHKSKENFRRRLMACRHAKWKRNTFFTVINHVIAFPVTWSIYNNTKLIFWKGDTAAAAADVSWVCFQKVWEGCIIVYVWNIATPFFTLAFFFLPEGILIWRGTLLFNIFFFRFLENKIRMQLSKNKTRIYVFYKCKKIKRLL